MFISSTWDVKEPAHYSKRVGHEVPGVVAVLEYRPRPAASGRTQDLINIGLGMMPWQQICHA